MPEISANIMETCLKGKIMKLITYNHNQKISCGILTEKGIINIASVWPGPNPPQSVKEILERGDECLKQLSELVNTADIYTPLDSVQLLAPIPRPGKILGLAGNYSQHIAEAGLKLGLSDSPRPTTVPRPFLMPATAVIGPNSTIPWPNFSEQIDYEIELAIVIGKTAKCVTADTALNYVCGYCIANDVSARSVTFKKNRTPRPWDEFFDWLNGKWADSFLPTGPYLLTADEIGDVQNLDMQLTVNGQPRQQANTSQMLFSVAQIVSFLSNLMTLEPGDIIATGTPAGVGMASGNFLNAGDKIVCSIEKLGTLQNTLGKKPDKFYTPLTK
jgi:2-keto-4-pentenoate hydratase/2-oxohepta-3-ene-1,7-dioic acid hydratase in catechol pathway